MILVCGEALVDILVSTEPAPGTTIARLGGAPYNVAVGLARLGVPSAFFGGISTDPVGVALLASLRHEGVATGFVRPSHAPSMLALAGVGPTGAATYSFPVSHGADKDLPEPAGVMAHKSQFSAAVFSSFLAFHPETAPVMLDLARALAPGAVICLDPNVRLALVPERGLWRAGLDAFLGSVDILKISDEDIRHIYGNDVSFAELAQQWFGKGVALVFITRGAEGASVHFRDGSELAMPAPEVAVADTVGAGDSFLAALLGYLHHAGCLNRQALEDRAHVAHALSVAITAAALTCQRHGADLPRLHELPGLATH